MRRRNRCSWCGELGHNQRTCPKKKARIKEIYADNPKALEQYQNSKKRRSPRCGYCGDRGHTFRTCESFTVMVEEQSRIAIERRTNIKKIFELEGLGPGALMVCPTDWGVRHSRPDFIKKENGGNKQDFIAMVMEIDYNQILNDETIPDAYGYSAFRPVKIRALEDPTFTQWVQIPGNIFGREPQEPIGFREVTETRLVSPAVSNIPEDFLDKEVILKSTYNWARSRFTKNK